MDRAAVGVIDGIPVPRGAVTLEMLAATFDGWRIFDAAGRFFAFRSGVGFSPDGPQSLIRPVLTAGSVDDLAWLLCMQARYLLMSAAELHAEWLEHADTAGEPEAAFAGSCGDPAARRDEWLAGHPGGTVSQPSPAHLGMRAMVDEVILAVAYGDLESLMNQVAVAEAVGACPRHPRTGPDGEAS